MSGLPDLNADAVTVAKQLVGCRLYMKENDEKLVGGVISETEAYMPYDQASHSSRGMTKRNAAMFERGGTVYVYFIYGMHYCVNITTGPIGSGQAVLIRSIIPDKGIEIMRRRRRFTSEKQLCNGPAKVCEALGITARENGVLLQQDRLLLYPSILHNATVLATKRIGITKDTDRLWRFQLSGE